MKYLTFFVLVLFVCSCKNKEISEIKTINVLTQEGTELKGLSEIATDIQYIPLETHPDGLMKFVNYLKTDADKFYISTVIEILCFDRSGKFLYKLDQQGRGPNEYVYISDYDINSEKKQMITLTRGKLYFYNIADNGFSLLKHLDLSIQPQYADFIPGQDNIMLSFTAATGENEYQTVIINPEGDTLFKKPNYYRFTKNTKVYMGFSADNIIYPMDDIIRIKGLFSDTLFSLKSNREIVPYMIMNIEGKGITTDFLANVDAAAASSGTSPASGFLMISQLNETEKYLFYRYYYQQSGKWIVYDKKTEEERFFDSKILLKDDISGGVNVEPKFVCDGVIYSWTDALSFKKHMSDGEFRDSEVKNPQRKAELEKLAASISEDDNHILIAITPKK